MAKTSFPVPTLGPHLHRAAERAHARHRHVDADAAARHAAHRLRRAEARAGQHPEQEVIAQRLDSTRRPAHRAAPWPGWPRDRCLARRRDTRSSTLLRSRLAERRIRPSAGLPAARAPFGRLDPVVDRVPDQVHQRIADLVEHRAIELDLLAFDVEPDPLAQVARQIAHQPRKPIEHLPTGVIRAPITSACMLRHEPRRCDRSARRAPDRRRSAACRRAVLARRPARPPDSSARRAGGGRPDLAARAPARRRRRGTARRSAPTRRRPRVRMSAAISSSPPPSRARRPGGRRILPLELRGARPDAPRRAERLRLAHDERRLERPA